MSIKKSLDRSLLSMGFKISRDGVQNTADFENDRGRGHIDYWMNSRGCGYVVLVHDSQDRELKKYGTSNSFNGDDAILLMATKLKYSVLGLVFSRDCLGSRN